MSANPKRIPIKNHFGLVKHPNSPYWFVYYRDARNRRLKTSTKVRIDAPNSRQLARQMGESIVAGVEVIRNNVDAPGRLKEIYDRMLKASGQTVLDLPTVEDWFVRWISNQKSSVSPSSLQRYQIVADALSGYLKRVNRLKIPITEITSGDITAFRDSMAAGRSSTTVNFYVHVTRMIFGGAVETGLLQRNPAKVVKVVKTMKGEKIVKDVFTPAEVAALVAASPSNEWKLLILAAYFTSQRLGDIVRLQWADVNLEKNAIGFCQQKTGTVLSVPIHPQLLEHLKAGTSERPEVFPELSKRRIDGLSSAFKTIMKSANIDGDRQDGQRTDRKTFHSLRHSSISAMLDGNVSEEVRRKISGHSSSAIHGKYSHETRRAMDAAINSIPAV
jgi:integrase